MPKLTTLTLTQLKDILRAHDTTTTGNKAELVQRLEEVLGSDEIEQNTLNNILLGPNGVLLAQMERMNKMMEEMATRLAAAEEREKQRESKREENEHMCYRTSTVNDTSSDVVELNPQPEERVLRKQYSVREIADVIPEYDPTKIESVSAEHFVDHIESALEAYEFEPKSLLLAVYSRLQGVARLWLDGQPKLFRDWYTFKTELLDEFGTELNEAEINSKMSNSTRRQGEGVIDYCFRMNALGKRYQLSEAAIIKYTRDGLKHSTLQNAIASTKFTTMRQLRETATEFLSNTTTSTREEKNNTSNRFHNKHPENRNATKSEFGKPSGIECYNCHEKGHISKDCTKTQRKARCTMCERTTHKTEDCPNDPTKKRNINKIGDSANTYEDVVTSIKLNDRHMKAFMDTGSAVSLIRKTAVRATDEVKCCNKSLTGFAGGKFEANKKLIATIIIDNNTFEAELYVVQNDDLPEDVLVGRDVLCTKGKRLVIENDNIYVEQVVNTIASTDENILAELINENKHCFATNVAELGKCSSEKLQIKLTTDKPINLKPYRMPFVKRRIVADIINELLTYKIIRASKSHYASPVVLVEKKNGEHRLCVDYRSLNAITIKTPFPMPVLEEQFAQLANNRYFTSLDLRMGYHQIEISEDSKKYTAFITTEGLYEFNRMPFGLVNAPACFQRIMNRIIGELPRGEALAYLDDIIIPSRSVDEGIDRLKRFFQVLTRHGLTLRYDKCAFFQPEVEHLGHIINSNGIQPGRKKIMAVQNFKEPQNVTEVRRFLGLTGFFRKFVPDYAIISKPITKLLKKSEQEKFYWSNEQRCAFKDLIDKLVNAPVLDLYDQNAEHEVHTDACSIGLAGVLMQSRDSKPYRPVMYFSRHCTDAERKYHGYELEVLAVVESLQRFRVYLLGKHFRVITDCAAITTAKKEKELKQRISRWWLRMEEFDFETVYRPGNRLAYVDALSRAPVEPACEVEPAGFLYMLDEADWIVTMQQQDERIRFIVGVLLNKVKSDERKQLQQHFIVQNQRLYRKIVDEIKLVVPKGARLNILKHYHDNMGHFSLEKTIARIQRLFWFPKMRKLVKSYIASCIACCYNKAQRNKPEGELHFDTPIPIPFQVLHVDHLGPFRKSCKGNTHLLIFVDPFSKFCILKAVRNTSTTPIINTMKEIIGYFGLPRTIISDRGTAFTAKTFAKFCGNNNIKHVQNAVRTPRANGQVERINSTVLNMLRAAQDQKNWDINLSQLQWVLNSQQNSTTKYSPNDLVFSFNINDAVHNDLVSAINSELHTEFINDAELKRKLTLQNIAEERNKWKLRFDKKHSKPTIYATGDLVVIKNEPAATGESRKLEPKFKGPYAVAKALGRDRYMLTDVPGLQLKSKPFKSVYSADNMKRWCSEYPELNDNSEGEDDEENSSQTDNEAYQTSGRLKSGAAELSTSLVSNRSGIASYVLIKTK